MSFGKILLKPFSKFGVSLRLMQIATLGMGTVNVAMTFVSLALIEKAGRKTLMIVGLAIMAVTTTALLVCLVLVVSMEVNTWVPIHYGHGIILKIAHSFKRWLVFTC
jgi:hypothetical protein